MVSLRRLDSRGVGGMECDRNRRRRTTLLLVRLLRGYQQRTGRDSSLVNRDAPAEEVGSTRPAVVRSPVDHIPAAVGGIHRTAAADAHTAGFCSLSVARDTKPDSGSRR
jgi:hypothetical protein